MKVYFDNVNWEAEHTGPSSFAKRLAIQLGYMGIDVADPSDYDVALVFIEPTNKLRLDKPFVHRVDGMWFKPEQHQSGMNRLIALAHTNATAVIHQSEFDRVMLTKWLGTPKHSVVIYNGIALEKATLRSEALMDIRRRFDKVFVCSANWHPQKRLVDNINMFRSIRAKQYPNSCLIVMGSNPDVNVADPGVFYTGSLRHDLCAEVYSIADWMLHLAWLDHCPNVVIEAISQGCPVICSSEGGTKELVNDENGVIVKDVDEYDFSLVDYDNPPRVLDVPTLPDSFRANPNSVDIVKTAQKYAEVLQYAMNAPR